jgi:maltooligosyltrehalose synthase
MHTLVQRNQASEWADLLGQRVLQYALRGVPDTYMGEERPRHMGVDSDNRALPPFEANMRSLVALQELEARVPEDRLPRQLWKKGASGQVFQFALRALNRLRNSSDALFKEGDYAGLEVSGPRNLHAIASWRKLGDDHAIFIGSRFGRELRDEVREARRNW